MSRKIESCLFIHEEQIQSVFEILGRNENDLSYSLGYVMAESPQLTKTIISKVFKNIRFANQFIKLQAPGEGGGFTDFEITLDNEYFFLVEAKKGWVLPSIKQLKRYLPRFRNFKTNKRAFILLSDCKQEYFQKTYVDSLFNIPIRHVSWVEVLQVLDEVYYKATTNKEKFLLGQLKAYLKEVVIMENQESNKVYVVSLGDWIPSWSKLFWREIVKRGFYFYPQGKNWPKTPPNYVAFRYDGKLQSIHHIKKYEVVQDVHRYIPEIKRRKCRDHFLLWLDKGFEPRKELPNGNIWSNGRVWCMLDTLFTSKNIKEACEITKRREE